MMNFIVKSPIGAAFGAKMAGDSRRYRSLALVIDRVLSANKNRTTTANHYFFAEAA